MENFYLAFFILLLPGLVFLVLLVAQKKGDAWGSGLATGALFVVALLALVLAGRLWGSPGQSLSLPWFSLNRRVYFDLDFRLDSLGGLMIALVSLVSALVHLYSLAYMRSDPAKTRYFAYLGLFTFAMLGLVMSDNLLVMYFFWELVGLSSYLLIGFWYEKPAAFRAAKKAFLLNRIGDAGFLIGIFLVYQAFGTWQISEIAHQLFQNHTQLPVSHAYFSLTGFFLFCGAMAKSAQFPLQIWLPDAMEGPTPVSALIHAATMVAAGVYLVGRLFFMLNIEVLTIIACLGTITAFIGSFGALVQSDLKKILAYSTISQLGYMMMGLGVGAYSAGLLHLFTHAFFKAGLFFGSRGHYPRLARSGSGTKAVF
ncbi:MAG: NADH-quinone oxidoreductase subunit L [Microscillaceae bacterium]|nr:NADH-quinone oxidoreductase subunit L [Microscillaceae bacterium]